MQKKKKRSQRKWFWRIGCGIVVFVIVASIAYLLLLMAVAQALGAFGGNNSGCGTDDTAPFEGYAQVILPDNIENFISLCGGFQGWWAEAKFDIHPTDLEQFLSTTNIEYPLTITELPSRIHVPFQPDVLELENILYGISDEYEWLEEIVVDTRRSDKWTVYFVVLAG